MNAPPAPTDQPDAAEEAEDRRCMERLIRGNDAALGELMQRHADRLIAYLFRLLQDLTEAEELAEECFARVYERRARFDLARPVRPWLYTIATNLSRDRLRWRRRHPQVPLDHQPPDGPALQDTLPDPGVSPADHLTLRERADAVRTALANLPEELRIPVVLAEYEDRSVREIADILACSPKAAEMRLYRARQLLRSALRDQLASL